MLDIGGTFGMKTIDSVRLHSNMFNTLIQSRLLTTILQITLPATISATLACGLTQKLPRTHPSQDPFYDVPDSVESVSPGTILNSRKPPSPLTAFAAHPNKLEDSHQILYKTIDSLNQSTATVATILIPYNADYGKVLSYQIAEDAATIDCAPSYGLQWPSATDPALGVMASMAEILMIEAALDQGWVVVVPDHQGPQGAFMANELAAHATLDGLRAALLSGHFTNIETDATLALWGYSGGGTVSAWAAELQPIYAPELKMAGVAVGGIVPNLTTAITSMNKAPYAGLIPSGIVGLCKQYPELAHVVAQHLLPRYQPNLDKVTRQCASATVAQFFSDDITALFDIPGLVHSDSTFVEIFDTNALGKHHPSVPLFVYKSVGDEISPIQDTDALIDFYCDKGLSVQYLRDLGSNHESLGILGAPSALQWLGTVLQGQRQLHGCSRANVRSTLLAPNATTLPYYTIDGLLGILRS